MDGDKAYPEIVVPGEKRMYMSSVTIEKLDIAFTVVSWHADDTPSTGDCVIASVFLGCLRLST
jgi:hypothetical protein